MAALIPVEGATNVEPEVPVIGRFNVGDTVEYFWGDNAYEEERRDKSKGASIWNKTTKVVRVHKRPEDIEPVYDVEMTVLNADPARITTDSGTIIPNEMVNYQYNHGALPFQFRVVKKNDDGTFELVLLSKNVHFGVLRSPPTGDALRDPYLYAPPGWY